MNRNSVIVVDGDYTRRDFVTDALASKGYRVLPASDERGLAGTLRSDRPGLVIVADVGEVGYQSLLIARLRKGDVTGTPDRTPVIVLSEDKDEGYLVACFAAGADDFVSVDVTDAELQARVRAVIARSVGMPLLPRLVIDRLALDPGAQSACWDGQDVGVTATEFRLLACLASDPDRAWSRDELLARVWEFEATPHSRTVDAHACRLRAKLTAAGAAGWIVQRWATGYQLVDLDSLDPSTD
jgi:DNA-binding response OmpR family regulator